MDPAGGMVLGVGAVEPVELRTLAGTLYPDPGPDLGLRKRRSLQGAFSVVLAFVLRSEVKCTLSRQTEGSVTQYKWHVQRPWGREFRIMCLRN